MPRKHLLYKTCQNPECGRDFTTKHLHQKTCSIKCGTVLLRKRELEANEKEGINQVWACGGGVQSTAIAALICNGTLPKPDFAWIVDVGWEKTSTFNYMHDTLIPKLAEVGVALNIIKTTDYFDNALFDNAGYIKIPLYLKKDGIVLKCKTRCSGKWKQQVARKWLRSQGVKRCDTWVGISLDEKRRMNTSPVKWNQNKYPLVEMGIRREDCIDLVARSGWPKPEHTACFICPNQNDFQWLMTKESYPEDWKIAVEAERMIRTNQPDMFLHRLCKPLDQIDFGVFNFTGTIIGNECYGNCGPQL